MNYLVHHEFGQNLKTLKFDEEFITEYENTDINFWLSYWIYIYENILKNYKNFNNIQFLAYEKFNLDIALILKNLIQILYGMRDLILKITIKLKI